MLSSKATKDLLVTGALIGGLGAMVLGRMLDEEGATIFVSRPGA